MADSSLIKKLKILEVLVETENARTLILEPVEGWLPYYRAGQFLTLVFYTKYGEKRRSYSITSLPGDKYVRITVKKIDNGEFSRPLVYNSKPGDIFYSSGISGLFLLPDRYTDNNFCFLAAGSGITPCLALIKTILFNSSAPVILFYSNKNPADALFINDLKELQSKHPTQLKVHFLFSNHHEIYYKRLSKWLLDLLLKDYLKSGTDKTLFYLCGPYEYMQMAEIVLLSRTTKNHIVKENFSSLPRVVLPEPPDKEMHKVTIHINGNTHLLNVQYPNSILKTAMAHNIELPYSCQAGRCASCIATCTRGQVWMAYNEVLVDSEIAKGRILTCQGFPIGGDVEIEFDQFN